MYYNCTLTFCYKAVGFHTTLAPPNSSLILGGLTSRLTERLAAEKVDLVRQAYSGGPDVNFPLLVVCVNVSRIGADAKEALKGIPKGIHGRRLKRVKILRHFVQPFFAKRKTLIGENMCI